MNIKYITVFFLFFAIACGSKNEEPKADTPAAAPDSTGDVATLTPAQLQTAGVQTDTLQKKELSSVIKVNGSIDVPPQNMVSVSAPLGGYLRSTQMLPGMHVNKGQTVALMEDIQYIQMQQDYLTTKAGLAYDETEYATAKRIKPKQSGKR